MSASTAASGWRRVKLDGRVAARRPRRGRREAGEAILRSSAAASTSRQVRPLAGNRSRSRGRTGHLCCARTSGAGRAGDRRRRSRGGRIPEHGDTYFLVDPLDGTKEFIRGGHDYTVNIGLIDGGFRPGRRLRARPGTLHKGVVGVGAWVVDVRGRAIKVRDAQSL